MIITIPFRPISINNMYNANRKFGMKLESKKWCYEINHILSGYEKEFKKLRDEYIPLEHGLKVTMIFYYENFYTKSGGISTKIYDLSNTEKLILDLCVDKAHFGSAPYKSPNLNLNDSIVTTLTSKKLPSDRDWFTVQIELEELP